ncbi:acyltransferase [Novosphingobium sp. PP1Y]|uniref:acyltransferase family protein n=1 Tax=Novosphingobium sp. PP1Y TaxID=702113 RepID=UPI00020EF484|nr:acyltransferase [Novosphingobium sp. PP1Y]CCA92713.1 putative O-acyltransferase, transmembrane [Novosphingobium sp. PP1Y]
MRQTHDAFGGGVVRLGQLDGLRGIAVLVIVLGYQAQALFAAGSFDHAGPVIGWLHAWGWSIVDLFFVISGFIFAHIYVGGRGLGSRDELVSFTFGRVARLYPLHLLLLILCAALYWGAPQNGEAALLTHLLMLQGLVQPAVQSFNPAAWLLSVEAICCGFFGLALHAGRPTLLKFSVAAIFVSTVFVLTFGLPGGPWNQDLLMRGILGFFIGQILWRRRVELRKSSPLLLSVIFVLAIALDMGNVSPLLPLSLLAWPSLLLLALRIPLLESRVLLWLGDRSYAIFLVHVPLLDLIVRIIGRQEGSGWFMLGATLLYGLAVLIASELLYLLAEVPTRRLVRGRIDMRDVGLTRALPSRG